MSINPVNALRAGASWFIGAAAVLTVGGLLLLGYGLWRTPVSRPEAEELRSHFQTRHARLLELSTSAEVVRPQNPVPHATEIIALLHDARRVHTEALEFFVDKDVPVWRWHGAVAASHKSEERQLEYWFAFHSEKLGLRRLEVRGLTSHELQYAFRYGTDGRVWFERLRDGAAFTCHTNGALASVRVPLKDGVWETNWNSGGALTERRPAAKRP